MKCITRKHSFCSSCGATVPESPHKKHFPLNIALCIVLGISLVFNIILLCKPKASSQFEGKGFSSPEAAITAYAEAFRDGDVEGMIATFAVESFVDCYDLEASIAQAGYYDFYNSDVGLPNDSDYKQQVNCYTRVAWITKQIRNGYFTLTNVDNSRSIQSFHHETKETDVDALMQQLSDPKFDDALSNVKIGNVLNKDNFMTNEDYFNMLNNYPHLNVDELGDVAIEIEFDGKQYCLFMLTAKIEGKWYNISFVSPLGIVNGMDINSGGFMEKGEEK